MYNKSMLFDIQEMQKQKFTSSRKLFMWYKIVLLHDILYAISDRHRVLFSKFDVTKDCIAAYKAAYKFFITFLSKK